MPDLNRRMFIGSTLENIAKFFFTIKTSNIIFSAPGRMENANSRKNTPRSQQALVSQIFTKCGNYIMPNAPKNANYVVLAFNSPTSLHPKIIYFETQKQVSGYISQSLRKGRPAYFMDVERENQIVK